jgi:ribonuclease BN (tRNA processing enzyme)
VNVLLLGVRGSRPAPGLDFHRVGGNTSCVVIEAAAGRHLVLDAGTGLTRLATELGDRPLHGSILLTHLHWDHVHGLPFLPNADRADAEVDLYLPAQQSAGAVELLSRSMSPPHFPIEPTDLHGTWGFHTIDDGEHSIDGFDVVAADVSHKGGRTFGYRVSDASGSIAYLPDHAPQVATPDLLASAHRVASGVDVLFHGGQFVESERHLADSYGHATIDDAIAFAEAAGVGRLVLLHHSPARSDDAVDQLASTVGAAALPVAFGREGDRLTVPSPS